jgi:hypothetical protein
MYFKKYDENIVTHKDLTKEIQLKWNVKIKETPVMTGVTRTI